jgi:hypothetical protein
VFVCEYHYTATEHDPDRPWIVLGSEHCIVELADDASFFEWAYERWPAPRFLTRSSFSCRRTLGWQRCFPPTLR